MQTLIVVAVLSEDAGELHVSVSRVRTAPPVTVEASGEDLPVSRPGLASCRRDNVFPLRRVAGAGR